MVTISCDLRCLKLHNVITWLKPQKRFSVSQVNKGQTAFAVLGKERVKNLPSPAANESLPFWFQGNFAASFVFNFCLREFLLSTFTNRFELRCEPK